MSALLAVSALVLALGVGLVLGALLMAYRADLGSPGVALVSRERRRQKRKGYSMDHDRLHMATQGLGHLGSTGVAFTLRGLGHDPGKYYAFDGPMPAPKVGPDGLPPQLRDLVVGAALIVAEVDLQFRLMDDFERRQAGNGVAETMTAKQTQTPKNDAIAGPFAAFDRALADTEEILDWIEGRDGSH